MVHNLVLTDESELIYRSQCGDRNAFAQLAEHYWERLYRWLCHLTHNRHTAEDVAQEAILKAMASLATFRAGGNFQAWLFRIAHNTHRNQLRGNRRRLRFPEDVASTAEGPAELAMTKEGLQLLARAVGRLPSDFRAAFLLRTDENMSFQAIAEVLEVTEETARWRVFKARQKLMDVLAPEGERKAP